MKQPEQTHYYLIGNEIKKGKLMPKIKLFDAALTFVAKQDTWLNSLQPCSIKHRELGELIKYVSENNANIDFYNPIEVTDIIEKDCKSECHLSLSKKCICPDYRFKQPKSEANEWISVLLGLPNDGIEVSVRLDCAYNGNGIIEPKSSAKFNHSTKYWESGLSTLYSVTHWKPLI